jgi:PAS domain-containing protein
VPKGGINSKRAFEGSLDAHVEFMTPFMPTAHGQGRGNSGVFLPSGDEIQVLDSFGETTYLGGSCGGLYNYKDADAMEETESLKGKPENKLPLASLPPESWQTYDIEYRVEKKDGKYVGKPRVTVYHNGIKIHDQAQVRGDPRKGNFHFQDHGNPVRFRNIWVLPIEQK